MTEQVHMDLVYFLRCEINGEKAVLRDDMELDKIVTEAKMQGCVMLVIDAIVSARNCDDFPCVEKFQRILMAYLAQKIRNRAQAEKLIGLLVSDGMNPVLVKGEQIAALYPKPLLRHASDIDLFLFHAEDKERAGEILRKAGGRLLEDGKAEAWKELVIVHPLAGIFELHSVLYHLDYQNELLHGEKILTEPLEDFVLGNHTALHTLGWTDNLKFLFVHFQKHFIYHRYKLRQIADILLYVKTYRDKINQKEWERFLAAIGQRKLFDTLIGVGILYLGFASEELYVATYSRKTVDMLLEDCFQGGLYGRETENDGVSRGMGAVNRRAIQNRAARYGLLKQQIRCVLVPEKSFLKEHYSYYKKHEIALPFAWGHNILSVLKGMVRAEKRNNERRTLLKQLTD